MSNLAELNWDHLVQLIYYGKQKANQEYCFNQRSVLSTPSFLHCAKTVILLYIVIASTSEKSWFFYYSSETIYLLRNVVEVWKEKKRITEFPVGSTYLWIKPWLMDGNPSFSSLHKLGMVFTQRQTSLPAYILERVALCTLNLSKIRCCTLQL